MLYTSGARFQQAGAGHRRGDARPALGYRDGFDGKVWPM